MKRPYLEDQEFQATPEKDENVEMDPRGLRAQLLNNLALCIIGNMGASADEFFQTVLNLEGFHLSRTPYLRYIVRSPYNPDRQSAILEGTTDVTPVIRKYLKECQSLGIFIACFPCNTVHYFINKAQENLDIFVVNMIEETVKYIQNEVSNPKIGVLASTGCQKVEVYDKLLQKYKLKYWKPTEENQYKYTSRVIHGSWVDENDHSKGRNQDGLNCGVITEELADLVSTQINIFVKEHKVNTIIYGCTELPLLGKWLNEKHPDITFVDPMVILSRYLISTFNYMGQILKSPIDFEDLPSVKNKKNIDNPSEAAFYLIYKMGNYLVKNSGR